MNIKQILAATALGVASVSTSALPISGGISFSSDGDPFTFDTTTNTVDFADGETNAEVDDVSGDFMDYFSLGDATTFFDFTYDPFVGPANIWEATATVGANSGDLITFSLDTLNVLLETSTLVVLEGVGNISDGTDIIQGGWNITMNEAGGTFSWSSSSYTPVPEPAIMILLGIGLAGLGIARRTAR